MKNRSASLPKLVLFSLSAALAACAAIGASPDAEADAEATAVFLEGADAALGRRYFLQCQACHTLAEDGIDQVGPNLWGILGRQAASREGFTYSSSLRDVDVQWNVEALDEFLTKPYDFAPGTIMIFNGIADEKIRRDLIAYVVQETTASRRTK